jgi:hypothetical protein
MSRFWLETRGVVTYALMGADDKGIMGKYGHKGVEIATFGAGELNALHAALGEHVTEASGDVDIMYGEEKIGVVRGEDVGVEQVLCPNCRSPLVGSRTCAECGAVVMQEFVLPDYRRAPPWDGKGAGAIHVRHRDGYVAPSQPAEAHCAPNAGVGEGERRLARIRDERINALERRVGGDFLLSHEKHITAMGERVDELENMLPIIKDAASGAQDAVISMQRVVSNHLESHMKKEPTSSPAITLDGNCFGHMRSNGDGSFTFTKEPT